jgi:hypothetical protein
MSLLGELSSHQEVLILDLRLKPHFKPFVDLDYCIFVLFFIVFILSVIMDNFSECFDTAYQIQCELGSMDSDMIQLFLLLRLP